MLGDACAPCYTLIGGNGNVAPIIYLRDMEQSNAYDITLYTDGAASGNPGPGGYGTLLIWGPHVKELSEGFELTTNNRMELMAVIRGLQTLKFPKCNVTIYSDSKYVVDAVEKGWVFGWEKTRFKNKKNPDLWMEFLKEYRKHSVKFVWVKGHASIPGNERCDRLAVAAAADKKNLKVDHGYVSGTAEGGQG